MSSETPRSRLSLAQTPALLDERAPRALPGWSVLVAVVILLVVGIALLSRGLVERFHGPGASNALLAIGASLVVVAFAGLRGLLSVTPGEAVVWVVEDTARALFAVDNYIEFVRVQAEAGVRHIASGYAYDTRGSDIPSLRENADGIDEELSSEIAARVTAAGVTVVESRLTRLAYAPEIAQAMLRVQQANAVVAARHRIVEGAVGMVELALDRLSADAVIELDEERKATMVGNLLVVLCSDHDLQPVVNAGSLY